MTQKNTSRKIVFVINDFMVGGAQRQLARQLRCYHRERFTCSVITLFQDQKKEAAHFILPEDVTFYRLSFKGFLDVVHVFRLAKLLHSLKPDVVVSSLFFSNTLCRILKPFLGYASIAREHNTYTYKSRWAIWVDRLLAKFSYKIVAVSTEVARFTSAQEHIPIEKFVVIQNGIDLQEVRAAQAKYQLGAKQEVYARLGLLPDQKLMVNNGRMTSQKNHRSLFDAFIEFGSAHPEYALCILGGGGMLEELRVYVREKGFEKRIFLLGAVPDVEIYYLASEYLISASFIEGLSNAHLEALAFGLPIVVTDTGGTQELLRDGKNGLLIKGFSKDAIREAMEQMVHVNTEPMKAEAFRTAQEFDIEKTVAQYEQLFINCVEHYVRHSWVEFS